MIVPYNCGHYYLKVTKMYLSIATFNVQFCISKRYIDQDYA